MSPFSTGEDVAAEVSSGVASGPFELSAVFDPDEEQAAAHRTEAAMSGSSLVHRRTLDWRREVLTAALSASPTRCLKSGRPWPGVLGGEVAGEHNCAVAAGRRRHPRYRSKADVLFPQQTYLSTRVRLSFRTSNPAKHDGVSTPVRAGSPTAHIAKTAAMTARTAMTRPIATNSSP